MTTTTPAATSSSVNRLTVEVPASWRNSSSSTSKPSRPSPGNRSRPLSRAMRRTDPDAPDNDGSRLLDHTRQYIHDFDQAAAASSSGQEVVSRMTAKYPDLGNPYTLWLAAYTQPYGQ